MTETRMDAGDVERPLRSVKGCLYAAHGVYLILAGLVVAVFCWVIPYLLQQVVASDLIEPDRVRPLARAVLDHRDGMPLLGLPAVVFGVLTVLKMPRRWLWLTLGLVSLIAAAVLLLYTFVVTIGLLYQASG